MVCLITVTLTSLNWIKFSSQFVNGSLENQNTSDSGSHSADSDSVKIIVDDFSYIIDNRHIFNYDKGDVILHLHIQKTGGRHFEDILQRRVVGCHGNSTPDDKCDMEKLPRGWIFSW